MSAGVIHGEGLGKRYRRGLLVFQGEEGSVGDRV